VSSLDVSTQTCADDAAERGAYLDAVSRLLWPRSSRTSRRGAGPQAERERLIAPSVKMPRVLLPAGNRQAAAHAMRAYGVRLSGRARLLQATLAGLIRLGLAPWAMPSRLSLDGDEPSIDTYLEHVLGQSVITSLALTPSRANRKPVLHVLDAKGHTVGWAKLGVDELTRALVRRESEVLQRLQGGIEPTLRAPNVVHRGTWRGLDVLVLSPLPVPQTIMPRSDTLSRAMRTLAASTIGDDSGDRETYADVLADRARNIALRASATNRMALEQLHPILDTVRAASAASSLPSGTWHGDWTPWNCGEADRRIYIWDWERCAGSVPVGFDALHYRLQHAVIRQGIPLPAAARHCLQTASEVLAAWGMPSRDTRLVAALYLIEIALRYLADDQRTAGGLGGSIETWIIPALTEWQRSRDFAKQPRP
jgi:hypothetical protein